MMEDAFKPKKRIFMALTSVSALIGAIMVYMVWKVTVPGLQQINWTLPIAFGVFSVIIVIALLSGVVGIVMALMGIPVMRFFFFWAWKAINILFPFAVVLGRIFNIPREKIEQSFIEVSNNLVLQHKVKVPANRIMILTPHCIQRDTCVHKITKYGCSFAVATGGTLARQMVKQARPKAIVAVACERDLTSGIQDVFPLPVLGVLNERPFGPCFNTKVDINKLEAAILTFMDDEEANEKNAEAKQQAS